MLESDLNSTGSIKIGLKSKYFKYNGFYYDFKWCGPRHYKQINTDPLHCSKDLNLLGF